MLPLIVLPLKTPLIWALDHVQLTEVLGHDLLLSPWVTLVQPSLQCLPQFGVEHRSQAPWDVLGKKTVCFSQQPPISRHLSLPVVLLDGRNRAIVITESLARATAALRIASVRWRSYLPPKHRTEINPHRLCVRCDVIRIARLAFIRLTFVPRGTAEWLARVDRVR